LHNENGLILKLHESSMLVQQGADFPLFMRSLVMPAARKKKLLSMILLGIGAFLFPVNAAAESVTGTVQNGDTGTALENVLVEIYDSGRTALQGSATTDATGSYTIGSIAVGDIAVDFSLAGYVNTFGSYTVVSGQTLSAGTVELAPDPGAPPNDVGTISGTALDATDAVTTVAGATIELRAGINQTSGAAAFTTTTNGTGDFTIPNVPPGTYTLLAILTGSFYDSPMIVVSIGGQVKTYTVLMSPVLLSGQIRIVLTWSGDASDPPDLDSHLYTPNISGSTHHVYYADRGSDVAAPYATLDVDDRDGAGPETITIQDSYDGTYEYRVHHYPAVAPVADTGNLWRSDAVVRVYDSAGLRYTFNVPPRVYLAEERWWHVLTYSYDSVAGTGRITAIDGLFIFGGGEWVDDGPGSSPCFVDTTTDGQLLNRWIKKARQFFKSLWSAR